MATDRQKAVQAAASHVRLSVPREKRDLAGMTALHYTQDPCVQH